MTETLADDLARIFGVPKTEVGHEKRNKNFQKSRLSDKARDNLVKYISKDYEALLTLQKVGFIDQGLMRKILTKAGLG